MIIRVLGGIVGLASIVTFGALIYIRADGVLAQITGIFMGILFLTYAIGGTKGLSKVAPALAKYKIGK